MTTQTFTIWHHTEFGLARETRKAKNLATLFEKMPNALVTFKKLKMKTGYVFGTLMKIKDLINHPTGCSILTTALTTKTTQYEQAR